MVWYKKMWLIFFSVCFSHTMQSMDTLKKILVNIKSTFTKDKNSHSSEAAYKNIQQDQYMPIPDEMSTEEDSYTKEKTEEQKISTKNQNTPYFDA